MAAESDTHLADLRAAAAAAGIERFRLLGRDQLIAALEDKGVDLGSIKPSPRRAPKPRQRDQQGAGKPRGDGGRDRGRQERGGRGGEGRGRRGGGERGKGGGDRGGQRKRREREEPAETYAVAGTLDVTPRGHGFIRAEGVQPGDEDVYVSASQIRRCALRPGDLVEGPARKPRRGERYTALVHVDKVNGAEPSEKRSSFDGMAARHPDHQLGVNIKALPRGDRKLLKSQRPLANLSAGERILVRAESGSPRFELLRSLVASLADKLGPDTFVLLIDVSPEELSEWEAEASGATIAAVPADASPAAAGRVAKLTLEQAKRRAETGVDVALIVDSLTRLAALEDDPATAKRIFGSGRALESPGGSLTVVATTIGAPDDQADRAVSTTESATVTLGSR